MRLKTYIGKDNPYSFQLAKTLPGIYRAYIVNLETKKHFWLLISNINWTKINERFEELKHD
jgi:hypothetical protein